MIADNLLPTIARRSAKALRKPHAPKITETQEHRVIAAYFRKVGLGGNARAIHIRNGWATKYSKIEALKMGALLGCPDWLFIDGGRAGFIELKPRGWKAHKARGGKYEPHEERQLDVHQLLRAAGCWVEICETLDEVLSTLRLHSVPVRDASPVTEALRREFAGTAA